MRILFRAVLFATLSLTAPGLGAPTDPVVGFPTNSTTSARFTWHDAQRNRDLPVKIYSPASGRGPFPVVIFSHGLGGTREAYEYLGRYWASRGYVSVHVQHHGSDDSVWRGAGFGNGMAAMRQAVADPRNAINRPRDVSFVIDELERLNRASPSFHDRLDLNRLGVAGHSFGAFTALAMAGQVFAPGTKLERSLADARVKAVIPMSAPVPANKTRLDESYARVRIPCLHMTGTRDASPIGDTQPEERRMPFDHCRNSDQYLITFQDGDHMVFSGRRQSSKQDRTIQELICESSTAFLDAYLRGDQHARSWLTDDFKAVLGTNGTFEMKLPK
jgi:predicted dienelactone hydrolase